MTTEAKPKPEFEPTLESTEEDAAASAAVESARSLAVHDSMIPRLHVGEPAYKQFAPEMLALVAKTIMPANYSLPELYMGLEIAATYGLDPFTKELWLVRMKTDGPVTALVGRDGLLAIAERHKDYQGFRNIEVHENDTFIYESDPRELPDGSFSHVKHSFTIGKPEARGKLIGAWAEVYRKDKPPVFFYAPLGDYQRGDNTPWGKQKVAMIRKCALANALRLAFRISGLYCGDEATGHAIEMATAREKQDDGTPKPLHVDPEWAARFETLFRVRNDITPGTYLPAKQRLVLEECGADEEKLLELEAKLEAEIVDAGGAVPLRAGVAEDDGDEVALEGEVEEPTTTP